MLSIFVVILFPFFYTLDSLDAITMKNPFTEVELEEQVILGGARRQNSLYENAFDPPSLLRKTLVTA